MRQVDLSEQEREQTGKKPRDYFMPLHLIGFKCVNESVSIRETFSRLYFLLSIPARIHTIRTCLIFAGNRVALRNNSLIGYVLCHCMRIIFHQRKTTWYAHLLIIFFVFSFFFTGECFRQCEFHFRDHCDLANQLIDTPFYLMLFRLMLDAIAMHIIVRRGL